MPAKPRAGNRDELHTPRLAIVYEPTGSLKPDPKNTRNHTKKQIRQIARSLSTFGFLGAVVTDAQKNIVCGHARVEAAKQLGLPEIPTICAEHLTPAELKAYAIADNKLTLNATWDEALLGDTFRELSLLDLDFSPDVTGFEIAEIDLLPAGRTHPASLLRDEAGPLCPARFLAGLSVLKPERLQLFRYLLRGCGSQSFLTRGLCECQRLSRRGKHIQPLWRRRTMQQ